MTPQKISAPTQNAPRVPLHLIPSTTPSIKVYLLRKGMTTTRICHPMSPFRVKLTDTCAEGATDKGIFRPTKLTTQSISERTKCLIV